MKYSWKWDPNLLGCHTLDSPLNCVNGLEQRYPRFGRLSRPVSHREFSHSPRNSITHPSIIESFLNICTCYFHFFFTSDFGSIHLPTLLDEFCCLFTWSTQVKNPIPHHSIREDVKIPTYKPHTNHKRSSVRSHTLAPTSICDLSHSLCWSPLTDLGHISSVTYVCHPLWFVCGYRKGILTSPLNAQKKTNYLPSTLRFCLDRFVRHCGDRWSNLVKRTRMAQSDRHSTLGISKVKPFFSNSNCLILEEK